MVDVETRQVSVRGRAKFIWRSTGNEWQEPSVHVTWQRLFRLPLEYT